MAKFIRLDMKGNWKGTEHISSMQGQAGECVCYEEPCVCGSEESWESGISCFELDDIGHAIEELRSYWMDIAMLDEDDYKDMQVTVFEGEKIDKGSDEEDAAICERTILETDAYEFMKKVYDTYEEHAGLYEIENEDEYYEKLEKLYKEMA